MDRIDKLILTQLQHNAAQPVADIARKVVVPDMAAYDTFYRKLIANVQLTDVSSSFAMEEIKYTTALPLPECDDDV